MPKTLIKIIRFPLFSISSVTSLFTVTVTVTVTVTRHIRNFVMTDYAYA